MWRHFTAAIAVVSEINMYVNNRTLELSDSSLT